MIYMFVCLFVCLLACLLVCIFECVGMGQTDRQRGNESETDREGGGR